LNKKYNYSFFVFFLLINQFSLASGYKYYIDSYFLDTKKAEYRLTLNGKYSIIVDNTGFIGTEYKDLTQIFIDICSAGTNCLSKVLEETIVLEGGYDTYSFEIKSPLTLDFVITSNKEVSTVLIDFDELSTFTNELTSYLESNTASTNWVFSMTFLGLVIYFLYRKNIFRKKI
jgi:hypothetical protein